MLATGQGAAQERLVLLLRATWAAAGHTSTDLHTEEATRAQPLAKAGSGKSGLAVTPC